MSRRTFGRYMRALRKEQGHTQETLAIEAGVSADTIRRVEVGNCSLRLDTLNRLSRGLGMSTSSVLAGYENGQRDEARELLDLIRSAEPKTVRTLTKLARLVIAELDGGDAHELDAGDEPDEGDQLDGDDEP